MNFETFLEKKGMLNEATDIGLIQKHFTNLLQLWSVTMESKLSPVGLPSTHPRHKEMDDTLREIYGVMKRGKLTISYPYTLADGEKFKVYFFDGFRREFFRKLATNTITETKEAYDTVFQIIGDRLLKLLKKAEKETLKLNNPNPELFNEEFNRLLDSEFSLLTKVMSHINEKPEGHTSDTTFGLEAEEKEG